MPDTIMSIKDYPFMEQKCVSCFGIKKVEIERRRLKKKQN